MMKIIVKKDTEFDTINKALKSLDKNEFNEIFISEGIYDEKIKIDFDNLTIVGESKNSTVITHADYANKIHAVDHRDYNTFRTATVTITGNNIILKNLTIQNTSSNPKKNGQAIALANYGNQTKIVNCVLSSEQDTLFTGPLPDDLVTRYIHFLPKDELFIEGTPKQLYLNTTIKGTIDYIFGCAYALFDKCTIITLDNNSETFAIAPAHSLFQNDGYVFYQCDFSFPNRNHNYLGRCWREYGKAIFIDNTYKGNLNSLGFLPWKMPDTKLNSRIFEYPLCEGRQDYVHIIKDKDKFISKVLQDFEY